MFILTLNDLCNLIFWLICYFWICSAPCETRHGDRSFRSASWEERGVPDGAEGMQLFPVRNQKTEAVDWFADLLPVIAGRDNRDWRVRDPGKCMT